MKSATKKARGATQRDQYLDVNLHSMYYSQPQQLYVLSMECPSAGPVQYPNRKESIFD
jgi:hypothetical protein